MNIYKQISSNNRQTVFILALFALIVWGLVAVASIMLDGSTELIPVYSIIVFGGLFIWTIIAYYFGASMITSFMGAKPIKRKTHFEIYNLVENIAITAGLPNPKVYIIKDESLNAFATGRNPRNSIIALTTGIIDKLSKRELEAVISHEMGHIANYDIRLQLIVITVIGAISMVGEVLMRARGKKAGPIVLTGVVIYLIGGPLLRLLKLALSRKREFLADATGSFYTRDPDALANALEKISKDSRVESADRMKSAAHLFIANPKKEPVAETNKQLKSDSFLTRLFSTHPPIFERIKRLRSKV